MSLNPIYLLSDEKIEEIKKNSIQVRELGEITATYVNEKTSIESTKGTEIAQPGDYIVTNFYGRNCNNIVKKDFFDEYEKIADNTCRMSRVYYAHNLQTSFLPFLNHIAPSGKKDFLLFYENKYGYQFREFLNTEEFEEMYTSV